MSEGQLRERLDKDAPTELEDRIRSDEGQHEDRDRNEEPGQAGTNQLGERCEAGAAPSGGSATFRPQEQSNQRSRRQDEVDGLACPQRVCDQPEQQAQEGQQRSKRKHAIAGRSASRGQVGSFWLER